MEPKIDYLKQRLDTFFFLKNSVFYHTTYLIVFYVCLVSVALPTLAGAAISFTETTQEAGLTYTGPTWGAQWTDYNGDGWPDLWVTNHESKEPNLYLNMEDGTFDEISGSIWDQIPYPYVDTHGAGWADFDNDGDQDVLVSGGTSDESNLFFINNNGILYERAETYGVSFTENRGRMPLWLDFDNDGLLDVYLNGIVPPYLAYAGLFQQNAATGFFENVNTLIGFENHGAVFSMLSDLTGDGVLDIITYDGGPQFPRYVYSMATIPFAEHRDEIFPPDTGYGADAAFADFNGDLLQDLYLVRSGGDEHAAQVTSTKLATNIVSSGCGCEKGITFKADGKVRILFSVQASSKGHPFYIGSSGLSPESFPSYISPNDPRIWGMSPRIPIYLELDPDDPRVNGIYPHEPGIDVGVYIGFDTNLNEWKIVSSQSLDETFWCKFTVETDSPVTDFNPLNINMFIPNADSLYIHNGSQLEEISLQQSGINERLPGRSVVAGDFDNDMDIDLYVMNSLKVMNIPNTLLENDGTGVFTEVPLAGGAEGTLLGTGSHVVTADYDRDGFLDLFLTNGMYPSPFDHLGPLQLFRNTGNNNHWIEIDLVGTTSNRDGIGARVLATAGGVTQLREQNGGMHKYSQNHTRIHFGLERNTTIQRLEVQWPSGTVQVLENIEADKIIQVVESSGIPQDKCNPYGKPNYNPATEDGIFLWKEGNVWHLRAVAGSSGWQKYIGSIVSDMDFVSVTPVNFERNDILDNSNPQEITFNINMARPYFDGIDFVVPTGARVSLDVQVNSGNATELVFIGGGRCPVDQLPYLLQLGASNNCEPNGEPNYNPATEDGVYLWKEGNVWHLRAIAGFSGWQRYTGSIVSDMPLISVTPVDLERWGDNLDTSDPREIIFDIQMLRSWLDGLDLEVPAGATISFDVQSTNGNAANLVFIGRDRCSVDQLPYQLP